MAVEYFPKRRVSRPNVRIQIDSSRLKGVSTESKKPVMLIGRAEDGKPNTVFKVKNIYNAQQIFRGGELLDAMELAWNPSDSGSEGAGTIYAMRVEDAKPATYTTKEGIVFQSSLYGDSANQVQLSLKTIDIGGQKSRNLEINFAPDNYRQVYRNVGTIFTLRKTETAPKYVAVEIKALSGDPSLGTATRDMVIYMGEDEGSAKTITFKLGTGEYTYANSLVNKINSIDGLEAIIPAGESKNINTLSLDDMPKTPVTDDNKGVAVTAIFADLCNLLGTDTLEGRNPYVIVQLQSGDNLGTKDNPIYKSNVKVDDFDQVNLTGGKRGTVPASWLDKFKQFSIEATGAGTTDNAGYYLVPLTDSPAIHKEASAFCSQQYDEGFPMRAIVGAGLNENVQELTARASDLRSPRAMLIGSSAEAPMSDGRKPMFPGYMMASLVAGLASGLEIGEAITFKQIKITNLGRNFNSAEKDTLNDNGVVIFEFVRNQSEGKYRIVDDVTTYADSSQPVYNEMSIGEGSDFLVSDMKTYLENNFIGQKVETTSDDYIKSKVNTFLADKKRRHEIQDFNQNEIQVVIDGEVAHITCVVYPVRSLKQIQVSLNYDTQVLSTER